MGHRPGLKEDAKNLVVIGSAAGIATLVTAGLLIGNALSSPSAHEPPRAPMAPVTVTVTQYETRAPLSGSNRLYGTVHTRHGERLTGFLRWDRNEGSWVDLLDALKPRERGGSSISGIRFGHVDRIQVLSNDAALFRLKSGVDVELGANASDLGSGLRALLVEDASGRVTELHWRDLEEVDFDAPPADVKPGEGRLFGTLTTSSGLEFTGHVTWDVDEIYTSDILDGDLQGERQRIPFGAIESIARYSDDAALVTLHGGREMILEGTNDVDESISGISVSDAALGQIKLDWDEFERVRFHGTAEEVSFSSLDGGKRIFGTVRTEDGSEYRGAIRWDADEAYTWEMLNGDFDDMDFNVEFGKIARIEKTTWGSEVTLTDGRSFELEDSNDVDDGNRGIIVEDDGRSVEVDWDDFSELRLEP